MENLFIIAKNAVEKELKEKHQGLVMTDDGLRRMMYVTDALQSLMRGSNVSNLDVYVDGQDMVISLEVDKVLTAPRNRDLLVAIDNATSLVIQRQAGNELIKLTFTFQSPLVVREN